MATSVIVTSDPKDIDQLLGALPKEIRSDITVLPT